MQQNQDPAQRFLVSAITNLVRAFLTPLYYAIRSDMGVQFSGFHPIAASLLFYGCAAKLIAMGSPIDGKVAALYVVLVALGYVRNTLQAKRRRRVRDWSVNSWSTGVTLLEPISFVVCRMCRKWGSDKPFVQKLVPVLLSIDFLHYVAEPGMLILVSAALLSIGSLVCVYTVLLAVALIIVRCDAELRLYLRAHEIADAKMLEHAVMSEFEGPAPARSAGSAVAQIPAALSNRTPVDDQSVFDSLSPDLQMLLVRDRATQH